MKFLQKLVNIFGGSDKDTPKTSEKRQSAQRNNAGDDSFAQLCAKAKTGDVVAQYNLFNQYAEKPEKREALKALFTDMMNSGDVEGKGLLGCLLNPIDIVNGAEIPANKLVSEAIEEGALIPAVLYGMFYAYPRGKRRYWDPQITDDCTIIIPVDEEKAVSLLSKAVEKLNTYSNEVKSAFHFVYGYLAYAFLCKSKKESEYVITNKYALQGFQLNDPLSCLVLADLYLGGKGGNEKNLDFELLYLKKAEQYKIASLGKVFELLLNQWYLHHYGLKEDAKQYKKYLVKSANLGSGDAMAWLAKYYESGADVLGIPKDTEKALSWRNKAIAKGADVTTCKMAKPIYY